MQWKLLINNIYYMLSNFSLQLSDEYKEHHIFEELEEMKDLYEGLSERSSYFLATGTRTIINYESYYFLSIYGTLDSIKTLLEIGRINDAIVLVRKIFDDILTEIYLDVTLKDKYNVFESFYVEEVQQWLDSSFRIPKLKKILKVLETSPKTKDLYPYFGWNTYLEHNRQLLDDSVHSNSYSKVLYNCNTVYLGERKVRMLKNISIILNQLMMIHVSFIFHLNPEYLAASDYMDYMEMSMTPPEGSEEWIANFAQDAFDRYIKLNTQLADYIKNTCCLQIL